MQYHYSNHHTLGHSLYTLGAFLLLFAVTTAVLAGCQPDAPRQTGPAANGTAIDMDADDIAV